MAQLVAGLALTIIVSPPASANYGCPGGGRGSGSPSTAPAVPPPVRPPTPPPPSTYVPGGLPGVGWGPPGSFPKVPPPSSSKPGLTAAEKDKLKEYRGRLVTQYLANTKKSDEFKAKRIALDTQIARLKSQMKEAESIEPRKYNRLDIELKLAERDREENFNLSKEYWNRSLENQRKIDEIDRKLGKN